MLQAYEEEACAAVGVVQLDAEACCVGGEPSLRAWPQETRRRIDEVHE